MRLPIASRLLARRAAAACAALAAGAAFAQAASSPVLTGKSVTESNLVDALSPAAVGDAGGDVDTGATRSLHVVGAAGATAAATAPRKKASASLLITFETNSSQLTARSKKQLAVVAAALRNDRLKEFNFDIEGHSDPRGDHSANLTLSQQRADAVRAYLVSDERIPESRLHAVGKGDGEPLNASDAAAPENRRVTIVTDAP